MHSRDAAWVVTALMVMALGLAASAAAMLGLI
jgi:hypothetical protein